MSSESDKLIRRKYYLNRKEKSNSYSKQYYKDHKGKIDLQKKEWYYKNRTKVLRRRAELKALRNGMASKN